MGSVKEELRGILTLAFDVKAGLGVLAPHTPVRLTGINEYEVEPYVGPGQTDLFPHIGYVLISNNKPNNDRQIVVATRGRAVQRLVAVQAISIGKAVTFNAAGKLILAGFQEAQSGFKVVDHLWDGGEVLKIGGQVLTEGIDFSTGPDVQTTARNISDAIATKVPGYRAYEDSGNTVIIKRAGNGLNFNNSLISISTNDDGADILVDPALEEVGDLSILDPYGLTLTKAAAPDDVIDVLVL